MLCKFHTANARLRIVSERVDIIDNVLISVTVFFQPQTCYLKPRLPIQYCISFLYSIQIGPPNPGLVKLNDKKKWTAKDVADSVLADKSTLVTDHSSITHGFLYSCCSYCNR